MASSEAEVKTNSDEEQEEFVDAPEEPTPPNPLASSSGEVDVAEGIHAIETAMDMMNKNMFKEALETLKPRADTCMYHAMGHCSLMFLKAAFSMDSESIETAVSDLNKTIALCNLHRRGVGVLESLSTWVFGGQRMDNYSTVELHSEVYFAEANLLLSFLTFIQDESLMNFIKGGLKIKSCFSLYKQLYSWLLTCENEGLEVDPNFAAGVRMGLGSFNLFISILPSRVLRVLEFVGFSGDRELGLKELEKGATSGTFRAPICTSFILFFHTGLSVMLGVGEIDPDYAETLLAPNLKKYPQSVQFLYFKGRVALLRGNIDQAIECFNAAIQAQSQWRQVHHLCWWELVWCYCGKMDWEKAATHADMLFKQSKWSKATFLYIKACCQIMNKDAPTDREELKKVMREIPPLKQRIAGKSLPIEKFAVSKAERYIEGASLSLCVLEMLYAHNFYVILARNPPLLNKFMKLLWIEEMDLEKNKDSNPWYIDDWCVMKMQQGVIFRWLKRHDEAERCLRAVIECGDTVEHDKYCVAAASAELGLLFLDTGALEEAQKYLDAAKSNYKGYQLESRIHFRVHAGHFKLAKLKAS